ncbi:RNA polymerase sigma-70 factor [Robertkochia solimangrovi]|uniref:RNA polymerase sigma-70 factor n=1 Tax=Robertkochia solimangrovi TaxID=2213046 RepID=UPI00117CE12B|nr:RNA polymerase sigma-70 factor [Robertkochia solimangrovi]TRZ41588.1 hypothetical protein DMZ48_16390 [Robertkochia solimangrovi]
MTTISELQQFEKVFRENYTFLCLKAFQVTKDQDVAKDIVQDFFTSFWKNREHTLISTSFQAYAAKAVKNLSIQYLEKLKKKISIDNSVIPDNGEEVEFSENDSNPKVLKLNELLNKLPESRRNIFIAYVVEGLTYSQIAEVEGISVNTVKTQMKRAYSFLREQAGKDILAIMLLSILLSK